MCKNYFLEKKKDLKYHVDQLAMEVNRMAQFVDSSSSDNIKYVSRQYQRGSDKYLVAHCALFCSKTRCMVFR